MKPTLQHDPETALTLALEHRPAPTVPADFTARVLAALPDQRTNHHFAVSRRWLHRVGVGRSIAAVAALLLTIALFVLAPHAAPSFASFAFDLELLLLAQLVAVAWFLTPLRKL